MNNRYCVILAGGCGQRLWPLSRRNRPKQFIPFVGQKTLIELAIERAMSLVHDKDHIVIVTNQTYKDMLEQTCGVMRHVIYEPVGRNTAPAILRACLYINEFDSAAVVVVLPADHFIPDVEQFSTVVGQLIEATGANDVIGLLGLVPTFPATGYGYIQRTAQQVHDVYPVYTVDRFHEKPNSQTAQFYIASGDMLWNIGIFVGRPDVFLSEYCAHALPIATGVQLYINGQIAYIDIPSVSIDVAVIEKSKKIIVSFAQFEWYDVGSLDTFVRVMIVHGGVQNDLISIQGEGNVAYTKKKIVACVGVSGICIIETDDAIIVVDQQKTDQVKLMDGLLREKQLSDLI